MECRDCHLSGGDQCPFNPKGIFPIEGYECCMVTANWDGKIEEEVKPKRKKPLKKKEIVGIKWKNTR